MMMMIIIMKIVLVIIIIINYYGGKMMAYVVPSVFVVYCMRLRGAERAKTAKTAKRARGELMLVQIASHILSKGAED